MACKCATHDPDEGRFMCAVTGDSCVYLLPNSAKCAKQFGEGPTQNEGVYEN